MTAPRIACLATLLCSASVLAQPPAPEPLPPPPPMPPTDFAPPPPASELLGPPSPMPPVDSAPPPPAFEPFAPPPPVPPAELTPPLPAPEAPHPPPARAQLPHFGVHLEAGVPDGLGASFVVSPVAFLRLEAGWLNNGVGSGARVGATLVAFPSSMVRPLLGVDAGAVLGGLGEWLPDLIPSSAVRDAVRGATVKFVNAQVGFELGSPNVALTVRVGGSYVDLALAEPALAPGSVSGFALRAFIPSARLGLLVCFG